CITQRVELNAVNIFQQGIPQQGVILGITHDRRNGGQPSLCRGTPTTLTHDELKPALTGRTNHYRLQQTKLPNGMHELVELFFIEDRTWLLRIRLDLTDWDLAVSRANGCRLWLTLFRIRRRNRRCTRHALRAARSGATMTGSRRAQSAGALGRLGL